MTRPMLPRGGRDRTLGRGRATTAALSLALLSLAIALGGCGSGADGEAMGGGDAGGLPSPSDLVVGEDGLSYLPGGTAPFTGVVAVSQREGAREGRLKTFTSYQNGKMHGPDIRWFPDGKVRRIYDYQAGEKTRHRTWFESGTAELDAMMENGVAIGRHRKWDEDGNLVFSSRFVGNLQWDGPTLAVEGDGTVLWDAVFDRGKYVSGMYPKHEEQMLIESGVMRPDQVQPDGGNPAGVWEAAQRERAERGAAAPAGGGAAPE